MREIIYIPKAKKKEVKEFNPERRELLKRGGFLGLVVSSFMLGRYLNFEELTSIGENKEGSNKIYSESGKAMVVIE